MTTLAVSLLGRPQLEIEGTRVRIGSRPLQLVVRLAIAPRHAATASRIAADLWSGVDGANGTLRVTMSRARDAVGRDRITQAAGTYTLVDVRLDTDEFEFDLAAARRSDRLVVERIADYQSALARWRGPSFDGLQHLDWAGPTARRFDELREQAFNEWAVLLLRAGDDDRVIAELGSRLSDDPTRERRCRLVTLAYYRRGDQSAALATIDRTRRTLREELGLSLGGDLADLEQRILRHDESLRSGIGASRRATDRSDDGELDARLRSARVMIRAEAFDEARTVLDDAEQRASGDDDRAVARIALCRAQLAMSSGEGDPHPLIDTAQRVGRRLRDGKLLANAALVRFGAGVPDDKHRALLDLTEPIPLLPADAPVLVDLLCAAAAVVALTDNAGSSHQLIAEAERVYAAVQSERSHAVLLVTRSIVTSFDPERFDEAVEDGRQAIDIARRSNDDTLIVLAIQALLRVWYSEGRIDEVDQHLDLLDSAARRAMLPFGRVRASLCRSTNALARGDLGAAHDWTVAAQTTGRELRTFAAESTTRSQRLLLMWERGDTAGLREATRERASAHPESVWTGLAAVAGDEGAARRLTSVAGRVPLDDTHPVFVAFAAMVAARRGDGELGRWCAPHLRALGDRTIVAGLGTTVLGFGRHFLGLALWAQGAHRAAAGEFEQAATLARDVGADLWEAYSLVDLWEVSQQGRLTVDDDVRARLERARELDAPRLVRLIDDALTDVRADVSATGS